MKFFINILLFLSFFFSVQAFAQSPAMVTSPAAIQPVEKNNTAAAKNEEKEKQDELKPYAPFDGTYPVKLNTPIKSLLFDRDILPNFYKRVLLIKDIRGPIKQTMGVITVPPDDDLPPTKIVAPSFYLSTILLPDDGNWSVWVNKQKVRNLDPNLGKLRIISVTKTTIEGEFQDNYLYQMSPFIQTKLKPLNNSVDWDFTSEKGDIKLSLNRGMVYFKIRLNQTFSIYDMEIMEGFVDSKTINLNSDGNPTSVAKEGATGADAILGTAGSASPAGKGAVTPDAAAPGVSTQNLPQPVPTAVKPTN